MWGSDWTKLRVGGLRWYLLTVIDFFSRWIVAWEVVPTVHAGNVKAIYQAGLKNQGISIHSETKPELRVDRGSPNTSGITQEFFEALGAELSFARDKAVPSIEYEFEEVVVSSYQSAGDANGESCPMRGSASLADNLKSLTLTREQQAAGGMITEHFLLCHSE
jgi:hypothetical protein